MRRYIAFLGLILTLSGQFNLLLALKKHGCEKLLDELGDAQSKFIYCATTKSVPVNLCEGCVDLYHNLTKDYENLIANDTCAKRYLNSDRINIVANTQGILTSLWQKANCENCFRDNYLIVYNVTSTQLQDCLQSASTDLVCFKCKNDYVKLNDFYLSMEKKVGGSVCFDLQDNMNRTRLNWSKTLKCCQREMKLTNFLIAVGVVVLLPIFTFYITAIVVTRRREANHGLLNEQEPELDAPSTSTLITAAVLSTSVEDPVAISARTEKIASVFSEAGTHLLDESNDEETPRIKKVAHTHLLDVSSDEEAPRGKKVAHSPESDYSSDDEPLEKPKRS
ncbi:osteopetrosis-associated transmembrane protein 1 [Drosophila mauritiana]|uniref:Osteopetrosis-associated transmembrane protein 1 n=1 Tax=Drosophila mauritiana TaxID=7226 RepID=A0A6P8KB48_DROMA|nr:osteopetrosis-associated transmembrane protein 1 [Drosophila mauritiana]